MKNYILICLLCCSSGLMAGSPAPPAIEGPAAVTLQGNTPGPVQASFQLDLSQSFADYHNGFEGTNWTWTLGSPMAISDYGLTLNVNVPPLSYSGGNIAISATSSYADGYTHTAGFNCQVIKLNFVNGVETSAKGTDSSHEENLNSGYAVLLFPNPSKGKFKLNLKLRETTDVEIKVVDLNGKEVFSSFEKQMSGNYLKEIALKNRTTGIYILKVKTNDVDLSERIILD